MSNGAAYGVQRWSAVHAHAWSDGQYVLASDAEAHEKAAVEECRKIAQDAIWAAQRSSRWQAIRDCIATVERLNNFETGTQFSGGFLPKRKVLSALNALLEGEK